MIRIFPLSFAEFAFSLMFFGKHDQAFKFCNNFLLDFFCHFKYYVLSFFPDKQIILEELGPYHVDPPYNGPWLTPCYTY